MATDDVVVKRSYGLCLTVVGVRMKRAMSFCSKSVFLNPFYLIVSVCLFLCVCATVRAVSIKLAKFHAQNRFCTGVCVLCCDFKLRRLISEKSIMCSGLAWD